jgi:predicted component of type VI protein secretion system
MKKKPSVINVLGKPYKVDYIKHTAIGSEDYGDCDYGKQLISIALGIGLELEQDTLLHEVLHALDYAAELKLSERQVSALAALLLGVFKANPDFADYITR